MKTTTIGKAFKLKSGAGLSAKNMIHGDFPVFGGNGINGYHNEFLFEEQKIVIGRVGAYCGNVHRTLPKSWITDNSLYIAESFEEYNSEYLVQLLRSLNLNKYASQSGQPLISAGRLKDVKIPLPPLKTQEFIASILDDAAALRDKTAQLLKEYDLLAQSIFLEMFGDPFLNPKNWEWKIINDIVKLVKGITYKPIQVNDSGIIVLRSTNVQKSELDLNNLKRVSKQVDRRFWVQPNDILMCNRNGSPRLVGKVAKISKIDENMTFGTFMTIVRSQYHNYLFYFFHSKAFRLQVKMQTSVAINQISLPLLKRVKVPLPPNELQNQFAEKIASIEQQKALAKQELKESEDLFNCLLQKAFKGELV